MYWVRLGYTYWQRIRECPHNEKNERNNNNKIYAIFMIKSPILNVQVK